MTHDWRNAMIEEAAKAMWSDPEQWATITEPVREDFRGMARAALAVFEKALGEATVTPTAHEVTTDEREALRELLGPILHKPLSEIVDAVMGFRRSEVPEPTCTCATHASEPQGEPSDRIPWETADGVVTAVDLDGTVHRAHPEPSDALPIWERPAAIEAARLAYQEAFEADYDAEDCIAFALRAAFSLREGEVQ